MRSYGQLCAVATALDAVGDRWTLLIVRELLIRGAARYTDLRAGLPGIATNLLAQRLRELEQSGIVRRFDAPPPVATALFELTDRGRELESVLDALAHWGGPLLAQPDPDAAFQTHWLALFARLRLTDHQPDRPPMTIELRTGDEPLTLTTHDGRIDARPGAAEHPDLVLDGPPPLIIDLLHGKLAPDQAQAQGLRHQGDLALLHRIQPHSANASCATNIEGPGASIRAVRHP